MRLFLLGFGWASVAGSAGDALIALWLLFLVTAGEADLMITVDAHLREHLGFLYWIRDVAEALLPQGVVRWIFELQALVYFPVRVVMSVLIGGWALAAAKRMAS